MVDCGPEGEAARTVLPLRQIRVGTGSQQASHERLVTAFRGGGQRPLAARLGPIRRRGVGVQQLLQARLVAESGGYRGRVSRTATQQVAREGQVVAPAPVGVAPQG